MKKVLTGILVLSLVLMTAGCESNQQGEEQAAEPEASAQADQQAEAEGEQAEQQEEAQQDAQAAEQAEEGGQWVESERYGLQFRVPEDWNVVKDEEGVSATAPDGTITVLLAGSESDRLAKETLNDLRADLSFSDVEFEKTGPTTINGLPVLEGRGSAVVEREEGAGQEIQFLGYAIRGEGDGMATLFIFSEAEMYEAKREEIEGIANTLVETSN